MGDQKSFSGQIFLGVKKVLGSKSFWVKKSFFSSQKSFLGRKSFRVKKVFLGQKHPAPPPTNFGKSYPDPKLKNNWGPLSSTFHVERRETLIEWKFESITNGPTDQRTDILDG